VSVNIAKKMQRARVERMKKPPIDVAPWFTCPLCGESACHCADAKPREFIEAVRHRAVRRLRKALQK